NAMAPATTTTADQPHRPISQPTAIKAAHGSAMLAVGIQVSPRSGAAKRNSERPAKSSTPRETKPSVAAPTTGGSVVKNALAVMCDTRCDDCSGFPAHRVEPARSGGRLAHGIGRLPGGRAHLRNSGIGEGRLRKSHADAGRTSRVRRRAAGCISADPRRLGTKWSDAHPAREGQ